MLIQNRAYIYSIPWISLASIAGTMSTLRFSRQQFFRVSVPHFSNLTLIVFLKKLTLKKYKSRLSYSVEINVVFPNSREIVREMKLPLLLFLFSVDMIG